MSGRNTFWFCIIVVIATMFYRLSPMIAEQDTVYRTYAPLVEVDALIQRRYVEPAPGRELVEGAIRGMMLQLDPYSGYIGPDRLADFRRRHSGEYVGIGLELGRVNGSITVIAPLDDSPALRAGLRPGDVLLAVDGRSTEDLSVVDVDNRLAGEPDTPVELTVVRRSGRRVRMNVTRSRVKRITVRGFRRRPRDRWDYFVDPERRIAYIRVAHFNEGMVRAFDTALRTIKQEQGAAVIIDLRFNPGGLMPQAVALVDRFVDSGTILTTVTRRRAVDTYTATAPYTDKETPLAVLINGGSASSSEIVAGALQDHHRALIVGERSFGKGSVQEFIMLQGGDAGLKLTVAHYRLPGGRIIHKTSDNAATDAWGIIPDLIVPLDDAGYDAMRARRLEVDAAPSPPDRTSATRTAAPLAGPAVRIDPQLQAAITALAARINNKS